jgi:hypothetical protein
MITEEQLSQKVLINLGLLEEEKYIEEANFLYAD